MIGGRGGSLRSETKKGAGERRPPFFSRWSKDRTLHPGARAVSDLDATVLDLADPVGGFDSRTAFAERLFQDDD